ncbi:circadian clock KaiB family protein [Mucilaginibacter sp. SMC90]|uniref:circadian clock KaiB family protein n=1 Tax=Mucilaginibacter sp. SMC90 TaxID=2929803 RepID=UPI001FB548E5|nr:circadian clock KaiB family protein [Mucilaginibacter sp. SMC90]UOE51333.1 circadian clock KaiB family protein [Mucilaginibacter sp. SMC90]
MDKEKCKLCLYIAGKTATTEKAIANLEKICSEQLSGEYAIEIIDLRENPQLAQQEQIIAVPTLIKKVPPSLHRLIGDLSNTEKVLVGLNIVSA